MSTVDGALYIPVPIILLALSEKTSNEVSCPAVFGGSSPELVVLLPDNASALPLAMGGHQIISAVKVFPVVFFNSAGSVM